MDREALREALVRINSGEELPPEELDEAVGAMLVHIGDADPVLRDEMIYRAFYKLILGHMLSEEQMRLILGTGMDEEHLFYRIGERGTDSVFTRTFSALLFSLLVAAHLESPFLTKGEIGDIRHALIGYLKSERDWRGYVPGKGWAHAAAHASDVLDELAKAPSLSRENLMEMLAVIRGIMSTGEMVFTHNEDGRMAQAVKTIFDREELTASDKIEWMNSLAAMPPMETMPEDMYSRINRRNLWMCVYFKLSAGQREELGQAAEEALKTIRV